MKRKYGLLVIVVGCILLLDQWTKYVVVEHLTLYQRVQVIQGFFDLTHVRNTGGAFGMLSGEKGGLGSFLFLGVSFLAVGIILFLIQRMKEHEIRLSVALSLVLGGALGNLIDRFRYGEVIDFLDLYVSSFHWPAFNIADASICVGIGLMALELLRRDGKKRTVR